jgi:hypothetical protein
LVIGAHPVTYRSHLELPIDLMKADIPNVISIEEYSCRETIVMGQSLKLRCDEVLRILWTFRVLYPWKPLGEVLSIPINDLIHDFCVIEIQ